MVAAVVAAVWMALAAWRETRDWRIAVTVFAGIIGLAAAVVDAFDPPNPMFCLYSRATWRAVACIDVLDLVEAKALGLTVAVWRDRLARLLRL